MIANLFAYGTLIPGCEPVGMAPVCSRMQLVGEATVPGTLYDLGGYPGVVEGEGIIRGVVLRVPPDAWPLLDAYEGCAGPGRLDALFRRIPTRATLASGDVLDCWLYVYARDVTGRPIVRTGRWQRRNSQV